MVRQLLRRLCRRREMETRKLIDSATNALLPTAPLVPLDTNTDDNADVCPPGLPTCGPVPEAQDPALPSPEREAPTMP
jgi:hypothetical protein